MKWGMIISQMTPFPIILDMYEATLLLKIQLKKSTLQKVHDGWENKVFFGTSSKKMPNLTLKGYQCIIP